MKPIHGTMIVFLLFVSMLFPTVTMAGPVDRDDGRSRPSRFEHPAPLLADAATQSAPSQQPPSSGRKLLRNVLIGAAVGAALTGTLATAVGDCGRCDGDYAEAILSGAMYGALIGAAIRIHPSRRPSPSRSPLQATVGPQLTKQVKAVNVKFRF